MEGVLYDMLSQLFSQMVGIKKIIISVDFKNSHDEKSVRCFVKAAEGLLFPLKSSLIFIHKPVIYLKHSEIKFVEFSRAESSGHTSSKSFDLSITKLGDDYPSCTFLNIDKEEYKILGNYFKNANIRMRTVDVETNRKKELDQIDNMPDPDGDSQLSENSAHGRRKGQGGGGEDDSSDEEDEDFNEDSAQQDEESEDDDEEDEEDENTSERNSP